MISFLTFTLRSHSVLVYCTIIITTMSTLAQEQNHQGNQDHDEKSIAKRTLYIVSFVIVFFGFVTAYILAPYFTPSPAPHNLNSTATIMLIINNVGISLLSVGVLTCTKFLDEKNAHAHKIQLWLYLSLGFAAILVCAMNLMGEIEHNRDGLGIAKSTSDIVVTWLYIITFGLFSYFKRDTYAG